MINKIVQQEIVLHIVKQMKMVNIVQDIVEVHKKRSIEFTYTIGLIICNDFFFLIDYQYVVVLERHSLHHVGDLLHLQEVLWYKLSKHQ